jgi:hypothetical protein
VAYRPNSQFICRRETRRLVVMWLAFPENRFRGSDTSAVNLQQPEFGLAADWEGNR